MHKYKLTKLDNGLRILTLPFKKALSFQVMVLVNTGSHFETKETNGISHFLEHMCFKGTKKRPSNIAITQELDSVGGSYNAFTGREFTGYFAKVAQQNKELALDVVSDIFLNSQFPVKEIEKEKGVIIEEINMYKDDPKSYVWDHWDQLLYPNQSVGFSIPGFKKNIQKFQKKDFIEYHRTQYRAGSSLIVVSGNFSEKEIINKIKKYFKNINLGQGKLIDKITEKQTQPQVFIENRKTDQTHFVLGFRGINYFDKREYALRLLNTIFDGGMSGMLFQTIRDKLGAAYYIRGTVVYYSNHGYWVVSAGIDNNRLEEVIKVILKEWGKLKTKTIGIQQLKKAKNFIIGRIALSLEDIHNLAYNFAFQELLENKILTPEQYLKKIKEVSLSDIRRVALDLLTPETLNLALIGPYKNKAKLLKLLKI